MNPFSWIFKKTERFDKEAAVLTEQQKQCKHEWIKLGSQESYYSHCLKCKLMRHDKDGDLINPLVYAKYGDA